MWAKPTPNTSQETYDADCGKPIVINALNSYDPNYLPGSKKLEYTWSCDNEEDVCKDYVSSGNSNF